MPISHLLRQRARFLRWMIVAGLVLAILHSLIEYFLTGLTGEEEAFLPLLLRSTVIAVFIAGSIGLAEVLLEPYFRKRPFWYIVVIRAILYTVLIAFWLIALNGLRNWLLFEVDFLTGVRGYLSDPVWRFNLPVVFTLMLLAVGLFQISTLHRRGELLNFILGRYHQPREEKRFFCFVDLKDSTAIAERLGNLAFGAFLKDYYADLTEAIRRTDAEVYQYIGDEIVLSWSYADARKDRRILDCFILMVRSIAKKKKHYLEKYGCYPQFKAGLHGGPCLITWVGEIKKEIVYVGDVLNTASRIQGECNRLGETFLISGEVVEQLALAGQPGVAFVEAFVPKGKTEEVRLYSVTA